MQQAVEETGTSGCPSEGEQEPTSSKKTPENRPTRLKETLENRPASFKKAPENRPTSFKETLESHLAHNAMAESSQSSSGEELITEQARMENQSSSSILESDTLGGLRSFSNRCVGVVYFHCCEHI